jgi:FkbM family methyltransferase
VAKLRDDAFKSIGRDRISLAKIRRRNDLKRIGTEYGGWVVPVSLLDSRSICYCLGCGEDISFDLGLIEAFGCNVFAFDPIPRAIEYVRKVAGQNPQYHFSDIGLWDKEDRLRFYVPRNGAHVSHSLLNLQKTDKYIEVRVNRLSQIMKENNHQKIDLLKIDIEGAEYKVIDSIIEDSVDIRVICVEFDEYCNPLDNEFKTRIRSAVNRLIAKGYTTVCSQGNANYTFVKKVSP